MVGSLTLSQAAELVLDHNIGNRPLSSKTKHEYKASYNNLLETLGDFYLSQLDETMLNQYVADRLANTKTKGPQIHRDLAFLSSLYTRCQKTPGGPKINPVRGYRAEVPDAEAFIGDFNRNLFSIMLGACRTDHQKLLIWIGFTTGMRMSEIRSLKWASIDFSDNLIRLPVKVVKGRTYKAIPMIQEVVDLLLNSTVANTQEYSEYVFPHRDDPTQCQTSFKTFFKRLKEVSGLDWLSPHKMRHAFNSWSLEDGIDPFTLQDLMGHKTDSMTRRYSHISIDAKHTAVKKLRLRKHTIDTKPK